MRKAAEKNISISRDFLVLHTTKLFVSVSHMQSIQSHLHHNSPELFLRLFAGDDDTCLEDWLDDVLCFAAFAASISVWEK